MASPFSVFRKNQKGLMVALVGLAMFAFIIMGNGDPYQEGSGLTMALMVICLVAGIGWGLGYKQGKGSEWATTGALFGAVLVAGFWWFGGSASYVETAAGNLSRGDVAELENRRRTANSFVQEVFATKRPFPSDLPEEFGGLDGRFKDQLLGRMQGEWQQQLSRHLFGFSGRNRNAPDDVVMGFLLAKEADELGIQVSDETVNQFIFGISDANDPLNQLEMAKILRNMKITEADLYAALRPEIRNQMAYELLRPRTYTTPQEYWDFYKRLTVTQSLATTAIPVEAFVDDSAEPSDAELAALFEQFRDVFPGQMGPGEPGFLQEPQVKLGYLAIDFETIRKRVTEPKEDEILAYYEANKEIYRNRSIPEFDGPDLPLPPPSKPKDPAASAEKTTDENSTDPEPDPDSPAPTDPTETDPTETDPDVPESPEARETPDEPAASESDDEQSSLGTDLLGTTLLSVSDDVPSEDSAASAETEEPGSDPAPDPTDPAPAETDPADPADPTESKDPVSERDDKPAAEPETDEFGTPGDDLPFEVTPGEKKPEFKPLEEVRDEIRDALIKERADERISKLLSESAEYMAQIGARFSTTTLDGLAGPDGGKGEATGEKPLTIRRVNEHMVKFAQERGIDYVVLPLQTGGEIRESGEAIGEAQMLSGNKTDGTPALEQFFDGSDFLLAPVPAGQAFGDARYVIWKLAEVPAHPAMLDVKTVKPSATLDAVADELGFNEEDRRRLFPRAGRLKSIGAYFAAHFDGDVKKGSSIKVGQFDLTAAEVSDGKATSLQLREPGIREQVVKAWRILQARPKAEARAKELAKMAEEKPNTALAIVFGDETVTGTDDGQKLEVLITPPFSWLTRQSTPSFGLQQSQSRPALSEVPLIDGAGEEFMQKVFEDLDNLQMGVVPNYRKSVYYVVKVRERSPEKPLESPTQREEFMSVVRAEGNPQVGGVYAMLAGGEGNMVLQNWARDFLQRYNVQWNRESAR